MANFNTYQTRNLYVAKDYTSDLDTAGDIYMGTTATGELFFQYRNSDGLLTRSDLIYPKNIVSLKKTTAAEMATPLLKYTIALTTEASANLSNCVGKVFTLTIHLRQFMSYDSADSLAYTFSVVGNSTNTASAAAFYKAVAKAIITNMPNLPEVPFKVFIGSTEITKSLADGSYPGSGALAIVPVPGKYIRGRMSKEVFELTFDSKLHNGSDPEPWAEVTPAKSDITGNTVIPSVYTVADLEYFALGERGDIYRGSLWPNNYDTKYAVDLTKEYDIVSVEYYWWGSAENVQKSPRMIQIACEVTGSGSQATSDADTIYDAIAAAMAGVASS